MIEVLTPPTTVADPVALFRALGDPTRLAIVGALAGGSRCVCDLQADLDAIAPSLLSHHLRTLREVGLISAERRGRWIFYRLEPAALDRVRAALPIPAAESAPPSVPPHCRE